MFRIAICEDDTTQLEYMKSLVQKWAEQSGVLCETDGYISAEQLMFSFDDDFPYELYILDIQMGKINGMELARRIRQRDKKAVLLFLTGLREYALEGYEVGAFRYLLKPVKEEEFYQLMEQIVREREEEPVRYFLLEQRGEVLKIPYCDIWSIEAKGHYVELSYREKTLEWKASLASLQEEFEENGFVTVRRGMLVNVSRISRVGKTECVLDNGAAVPVSRNQYKKVNEAFIKFYKGNSGGGIQ